MHGSGVHFGYLLKDNDTSGAEKTVKLIKQNVDNLRILGNSHSPISTKPIFCSLTEENLTDNSC